ncbi:MAG: hypothetical protein OQK82_07810, partial [Candidatus Pacearchaeota archaeon]|nr:hypothetical protein [Candidatus Pacearchaeota archaeon]
SSPKLASSQASVQKVNVPQVVKNSVSKPVVSVSPIVAKNPVASNPVVKTPTMPILQQKSIPSRLDRSKVIDTKLIEEAKKILNTNPENVGKKISEK